MADFLKKWGFVALACVGLALMAPMLHRAMSRFDIVIGLNNQSGLDVMQIRMAEPGEDYGVNLLAQPIPSGRIVRVPNRGNSCVRSVQVTFSNSEQQEFRDFDACASSSDLMLPERVGLGVQPGRTNPSFNVLNQGTRSIVFIHVSSVTASGWGPNRLAEGRTLEPGSSVPIFLPTGECRYDARVTFAGGQTAERRNVDTCRISFMAFP